MRKKKNYSVFNNFNKNYHYMKEPNYFDEYENEFSEELFHNLYRGVNNTVRNQDAEKKHDLSNSPRNGESDDN
ncbi:MAG TPA: hypothetical protein GX692_09135 [Acholeplasmataceae bacterium]|nr:hypothetical protein [Acholeplasmataceae bacterium]